MKEIFKSKPAWAFLIFHWLLFAFALYDRGDLDPMTFHPYYESALFLILLLLDLVWFVIIGFLSPAIIDPSLVYVLMGLLAGIQWFYFGYRLDLRFRSDRKLS